MTINRKTAVLLGLIGAMALYLVASRITWCSDIPALRGWDGSLDEISIARQAGTVRLHRKDAKWLIDDRGWAADPNTLKELERRLKEFRVTDRVSDGGYYERYDLTPEKAIRIVAVKGGKTVRTVIIGKKSGTSQHNYVRIDDRPGIYLTEGGTDMLVARTAEEFRDKEILRVARDAVTGFEIRYQGSVLVFTRHDEKKPADGGGTGDEKKAARDLAKKGEPPAYRWECAGRETIALDTAKVDSFLWSFNPLAALSFPDVKKEALGTALCQVTVKAFKKDITVSIHGRKDRDYLVSSSESPFVFALDEWRAKRYFITGLEEFKAAQ